KEKITLKFYDSEQDCQTDLSHAISLGRTEIVRSLVQYYYKKSENKNSENKSNPENYLRLVVPAFGQLCSKHPGTALELVKDISYFQSNRPAVWSHRKEKFAFSEMEKTVDDV